MGSLKVLIDHLTEVPRSDDFDILSYEAHE